MQAAVRSDLLPEQHQLTVGFSPNGKWLATAGPCRLWAVDTWQEGPQIAGTAFAFSPNSSLLTVETCAGSTRLVDLQTGREHVRFEDPNQERSFWMGFSSDGTYLVTNTDEPSIHIWDLPAVRHQLAEMDLDWDLPSNPPRAEPTNARPARIIVELGPFGTDPFTVAVRAYTVAITLMAGDPEAYYQRALAHSLLKHWQKALDDCNRAIKMRGDHIQSYYLRSQLHEWSGQYRQAATDLNEAIRRQPNRCRPQAKCGRPSTLSR